MERGGRCPVTGGLATRMGEDGFRKMCAGKRTWREYTLRGPRTVGEVKNISPEWRRCEKCKGRPENWPPELEIIDIETEELDMGKKTGVCDICGERKGLKHAARGGGLDVCTSCWGLLTAAGKPELLAKAVRLADAEEALANALGASAGGNAPDQARKQYEIWMGEAMRTLADALPHEDEGLDDTRSYADLPDLAERAKLKIIGQNAELYTLRDILKPAESETSIRAAERMVKAARAWAALMDRARDAGFGEIADGAPEIMAATYIMALNEVMAERDRLKAELAEREDAAPAAETMTTEETAQDVALLRWARAQLEVGRIGFHIEVREAAA